MFYFKYPSLAVLKKLSPKERVAYIEKKFRNDLNKLEEKLKNDNFKVIGTKRKPRGIEVESNPGTLKTIQKLPFIDKSYITAKKNHVELSEPYYCFKIILKIQVEGKLKGIQTVEEKFVLVKANSWHKAETKLKRDLKDYEKPYLNPYGQLVRWKFDSIEESYHTFITEKGDFNKPVEVFSQLSTRRMNAKDIWNGN